MQAIKVTIPGEFWDSQLYSGVLYLFTLNGEIITTDWHRSINFLAESYEDKQFETVLRIAFRDSSLLYNSRAKILFDDPKICSIIKSDFRELAKKDLLIPIDKLNDFSKKVDNPFPFPHSDSEVYYRRIYIGSLKGLLSSNFQLNTDSLSKNKIKMHWEGSVLDVSASARFTTIALATGDDGLREIELNPDNKEPIGNRDPRLVASSHCNACEWSYQSIYASSYVQDSFLALYNKKLKDPSNKKSRKYYREFEKIISSEEIFKEKGFSWGAHDKIYLYKKNKIIVITYEPGSKDMPFKSHDSIPLEPWKGDVVSASTASFGVVVECDKALVVMRSDNTIQTIPGEPVSWRIFPRSEDYTNQLHIIYEDRLEIWSFNHDYFIDQKTKLSGMKMIE